MGFIFAQCAATNCSVCTITECTNFPKDCSVSTNTNPPTCITITPVVETDNIIQQIWQSIVNFFLGIFVKDYSISTQDRADQSEKFTDYGSVTDLNNNSIDNRTTDSNQQFFLKGEYIQDTVNDKVNDKTIAKICDQKFYNLNDSINGTCTDFTIKSLALYFVTDNQSFLYDQNYNPISIPNDLKTKITTNTTPIITDSVEFAKYKIIYNDFYRIPPEKEDTINNKNASRVLRNPIPDGSQPAGGIPDNSDLIRTDIEEANKNLNKNFSPDGYSAGLPGLRPESEK